MAKLEMMAELFQMLCKEYDGAVLGKKATQKIFYFIERKGFGLNLRYGIHYYGPYSSKLDDIMYELESEGYLSINTNGPTHIINIGSREISGSSLNEEQQRIVKYVLDTFEHKSPLELEALSTMDYIANFILRGMAVDGEIIKKFKQIKGDKFDQAMIDSTLKELRELAFIL